MSKSDAQRRSYLADQMTMGERVEALERRLGGLESDVLEVDAEDIQYFHDELRSLGRRLGMLEKASNPGMTHFVGDNCPGGHQPSLTECGRIVVDANEWDRLIRLEKRVREFENVRAWGVSFSDAVTWQRWLQVTRELK